MRKRRIGLGLTPVLAFCLLAGVGYAVLQQKRYGEANQITAMLESVTAAHEAAIEQSSYQKAIWLEGVARILAIERQVVLLRRWGDAPFDKEELEKMQELAEVCNLSDYNATLRDCLTEEQYTRLQELRSKHDLEKFFSGRSP